MLKPISEIKANLGIEPNGRIQKFFTATCAKHMDKYVPYDEGNLARYKIISSDKILYDQPYAHYMYKGDVMGPNVPIKEGATIVGWFSPKKPKHYTVKKLKYNTSKGHDYAGPQWDKRMWSAEGQEVIKEVQNEVNRGSR